jgi:hypothetical protein
MFSMGSCPSCRRASWQSNNVTRLNEQVEAFKAKRFQAPIRPVQCTAEAANLVSCYK